MIQLLKTELGYQVRAKWGWFWTYWDDKADVFFLAFFQPKGNFLSLDRAQKVMACEQRRQIRLVKQKQNFVVAQTITKTDIEIEALHD